MSEANTSSKSSGKASNGTHDNWENLDQYVTALGGKRVIKKILIANNGIAAVKAIRSIRRWAYETFGNEREIHFAVMTTPEDLRSNAEYIRMADEFVEVPGGSNNFNFANVRLICETAESCRADAVWAGWGHASENPALPDALLRLNKLFIGPPSGPMRHLGDKIGSTLIAQSAGVPTIDWNGSNIALDYRAQGLPQEVYEQANLKSVEEAVAAAAAVGFPLMVKASEGGGGKGIRKVTEPAAMAAAYRQVAAEVPGSPIFIMKLASKARHLEVQVLADEYGDAIALFGRDCSVQRRHQKIVEEGPVLAAPPQVWRQMEEAAVRLARAVGYVNAGTVEYLFMEETNTFAFLELNPRLQVEHPVTEMITGVNLPASQLQVAMGIPLGNIPEIRRLYGKPTVASSNEDSKIDFYKDERLQAQGHVIAARITAENPDSGFQPTSGAVTELNFRSTPDVWGYFSVDSSGRVHEFADSQIGHLFSWGATREDARQHMVLALKELSIRGDIRTTVEYLVHMMESSDFKTNKIDTAWLDTRIQKNITASKPDAVLVAIVGCVWKAHAAYERRRSEFLSCLERGQHPPHLLLAVTDDFELIYDGVKYSMTAHRSGPNQITLVCNGSMLTTEFRSLSDGGLLVLIGGRSHVAYAHEESSGLRLLLDGATCQFTAEYDPTQIRAAMSGKLARYLVDDGSHIAAAAAFAEVEVMKMYMPLHVPESGVIHLVKPEGSVLEPGDLIATVVLDDPSKVYKAESFTGVLPLAVESLPAAQYAKYAKRWHIIARNAQKVISQALQGYAVPRSQLEQAWLDHDAAFASPEIPCCEFEELFSTLASRLPSRLSVAISEVVETFKQEFTQSCEKWASNPTCATLPSLPTFRFGDINALLDTFETSLQAAHQPKELAAFRTQITPLRDLAMKYRAGPAGAGRASLHAFMSEYLSVECLFGDGRRIEDAVSDLRTAAGQSKDGLARVFDSMRAHINLKQRNSVVIACMARVAEELELAKMAAPDPLVARAAPQQLSPAAGRISAVSEDAFDSVSVPGTRLSNAQDVAESVASVHSGFSEPGFVQLERTISPTPAGNERTLEPDVDEDDVALDILQPKSYTLWNPLSASAIMKSLTSPTSGLRSPPHSPLEPTDLRSFPSLLHAIAELRGLVYAAVTLEARQILIMHQQPSQKQRRAAVASLLTAIGATSDNAAGKEVASISEDAMAALVDDMQPLLDVLTTFFGSADAALRRNSVEVYIRRLYRMYLISQLTVADGNTAPRLTGVDPLISGELDFLAVRWLFQPDVGRTRVGQTYSDSAKSGMKHTKMRMTTVESTADFVALARAGPVNDAQSVFSRISSSSEPRIDEDQEFDEMAASAGVSPRKAVPVAHDSVRQRRGLMAAFDSLMHLKQRLPLLLKLLRHDPAVTVSDALRDPTAAEWQDPVHVLHITLLHSPILDPVISGSDKGGRVRFDSSSAFSTHSELSAADDEALEKAVVEALQSSLQSFAGDLRMAGVRRVTFSVPNPRIIGRVTTHTPIADQAKILAAQVVLGQVVPDVNPADIISSVTECISKEDAEASSFTGGGRPTFPWIYTFREGIDYAEDTIVRHIEPPASAHLELSRLSSFKVRPIPSANRIVHVYAAEPRETKGKDAAGRDESGRPVRSRLRYFVRAIVRQTARIPTLDSVYEQYPGPERMFVECLDALQVAMGDVLQDTTLPVGNNHIFLNVLPLAQVRPDYIEKVTKILARRYADRLRRLRVSQVEIRITVPSSVDGKPPIALRLISSNPTGYVLRVDTYVEAAMEDGRPPVFTSVAPAALGNLGVGDDTSVESNQPLNSQTPFPSMLRSLGLGLGVYSVGQDVSAFNASTLANFRGELDGKPVNSPYPLASPFDRQRALAAALSDTVYVYDFIELFSRAVEHEWKRYERSRGLVVPLRRPTSCVVAVELVMKRKQESSSADGARVARSAHAEKLPRPASDTFANEMGPSVRQSSVSSTSSFRESSSPLASQTASPMPEQERYDPACWELMEVARPPGGNDIGMVAWKMTLFTPQYPEGREIVIVANDITFRAGSFGTAEDTFFYLVSCFARTRGIPRVYLAANSGARIGLAESLKKLFRVAWTDPSEPSKGHRYLYLLREDIAKAAGEATQSKIDEGVSKGATEFGQEVGLPVNVRLLQDSAEQRYMILDIIGKEPDLGVENLRGSGLIAGETSRAYQEAFTLTYVTGRSVGIGAYLVRLGHRTIQKAGSAPIILTGYEALNKLMGSDVYSSNLQLGGPKIMFNNGVSHEVVENDYEGVSSIIKWLGYVPKGKGMPSPIMDVVRGDEVDRDVGYEIPATGQYDPRHALAGVYTESVARPESPSLQSWVPGLFDKDSFRECMAGWAKSVIVGRARLGGIPVGVIAPEVRSTTTIIPADPATPASKETSIPQAGQVWFPDSAFKTAQAIRDFSGEDLPILIVANWRGFSGGARDMFEEVLKYGSYIVDALVGVRQPVMVYIPPGGELRGGAWVVVDSTINPDFMEMYADPTSRGGVLEPSGTVSIKFRGKELMTTAHRLDPVLQQLDEELRAAEPSKASQIKKQIKSREENLSGVYLQIAQTFADLHDTPGRMSSVGVISGVVPWKRARSFFYWRLRRRLAELSLVNRLVAAAPQLSTTAATHLLRSWYVEGIAAQGVGHMVTPSLESSMWSDDIRVLRWLADTRDLLEARALTLRKESIAEQVLALGIEDPSAAVAGVVALLHRLAPDRREAVIASLRREVLCGPHPQLIPQSQTHSVPVPAFAAPLRASPNGWGKRSPHDPLSF